MSESLWNYESSKEQTRAEFDRMFRGITDPDERERLKLAKARDSYAQDITADYGLDESDSA